MIINRVSNCKGMIKSFEAEACKGFIASMNMHTVAYFLWNTA